MVAVGDALLNVLLGASSMILMGGSAVAFRKQRARTKRADDAETGDEPIVPHRTPSMSELGRWSMVLAFVSFMAGAHLLLYAIGVFLAPAVPAFQASTSWLLALFIWLAEIAVLVAPMVVLRMPASLMNVLRVGVAIIGLTIVHVLYGQSLIAGLFLPVSLVILMLAIRMEWQRRFGLAPEGPRDRALAIPPMQPPKHQHQSPLLHAPPQPPHHHHHHHHQHQHQHLHLRSILMADATYGLVESDASASVAPSAPSVSRLSILANVVASILLALYAAGCSPVAVHTKLGLFALFHGLLVAFGTQGDS